MGEEGGGGWAEWAGGRHRPFSLIKEFFKNASSDQRLFYMFTFFFRIGRKGFDHTDGEGGSK